jgi:hypothetical protein
MEKGIVCALTDEHADFMHECPDFEIDTIAVEKEKVRKANIKIEELSSATGGLHQVGIKNGAVAGIIIMILGLAWIIGGLIYLNAIFFYPFIFIAIGIGLIVKHFIKLNNQRKKDSFLKMQQDVLDIESLK